MNFFLRFLSFLYEVAYRCCYLSYRIFEKVLGTRVVLGIYLASFLSTLFVGLGFFAWAFAYFVLLPPDLGLPLHFQYNGGAIVLHGGTVDAGGGPAGSPGGRGPASSAVGARTSASSTCAEFGVLAEFATYGHREICAGDCTDSEYEDWVARTGAAAEDGSRPRSTGDHRAGAAEDEEESEAAATGRSGRAGTGPDGSAGADGGWFSLSKFRAYVLSSIAYLKHSLEEGQKNFNRLREKTCCPRLLENEKNRLFFPKTTEAAGAGGARGVTSWMGGSGSSSGLSGGGSLFSMGMGAGGEQGRVASIFSGVRQASFQIAEGAFGRIEERAKRTSLWSILLTARLPSGSSHNTGLGPVMISLSVEGRKAEKAEER